MDELLINLKILYIISLLLFHIILLMCTIKKFQYGYDKKTFIFAIIFSIIPIFNIWIIIIILSRSINLN